MSKQNFNPGFKSGTYVGDGNATKAITGVGFQPKFLIVYPQIPGTGGYYIGYKAVDDGTYTFVEKTDPRAYQEDHIISLDSDGFTVGDGTGSANYFNVNARNYAYQAWAEGV